MKSKYYYIIFIILITLTASINVCNSQENFEYVQSPDFRFSKAKGDIALRWSVKPIKGKYTVINYVKVKTQTGERKVGKKGVFMFASGMQVGIDLQTRNRYKDIVVLLKDPRSGDTISRSKLFDPDNGTYFLPSLNNVVQRGRTYYLEVRLISKSSGREEVIGDSVIIQ